MSAIVTYLIEGCPKKGEANQPDKGQRLYVSAKGLVFNRKYPTLLNFGVENEAELKMTPLIADYWY